MAVGSGVAIAAALILVPFGPLSDLLHGNQPFFGFDPKDAVLTLVRAQKIEIPKCAPGAPCACKAWSESLMAVQADSLSPRGVGGDFQAWEPWSKEDLEKVEHCDDFPCEVKLDAKEVDAMKKTAEKERLPRYLSLITERLERYQKNEERTEYEFPGNPVDPWKLFEERGMKSALVRGPESLFLRVLDFAPGKIKKIHQVVDRRSATASSSPLNSDTAVWLRDVYTDHYFDSWGEYTEVICDGEQGSVTVLSALLGEMDMLKKTGLIASLTRPKLKGAFEDNGKNYLTGEVERLKALVSKAMLSVAPAPSPTPHPSPIPSASPMVSPSPSIGK